MDLLTAKQLLKRTSENITAEILAHTYPIHTRGNGIITAKMQNPKGLQAEFNTHADIPRNVSSTRAIPTSLVFKMVEENPFIPFMSKNQAGMQGFNYLDGDELVQAIEAYLEGRDAALVSAKKQAALGCHKQVASRILDPYLYAKIIASSSNWANFLNLRCDAMTEPHFRLLARKMFEAINQSVARTDALHVPMIPEATKPKILAEGATIEFADALQAACEAKGMPARWWVSMAAHFLPISKEVTVTDHWDFSLYRALNDMDWKLRGRILESGEVKDYQLPDGNIVVLLLASAGRCARVSYNNIVTDSEDFIDDVRLGVSLMTSKHFSPAQHPAVPDTVNCNPGPMKGSGFVPLRMLFSNESVSTNHITLNTMSWAGDLALCLGEA